MASISIYNGSSAGYRKVSVDCSKRTVKQESTSRAQYGNAKIACLKV